jgi:Type I restriction enzyme R protein N terminus (HSDR_N)
MPMTEEDAKVKIVIPWLLEHGVRLEELTFETTLKVQVGRRTLEVKPARQSTSDTVSGRLDMLVSRDGRNLLVIEVKQPGCELTDRDRDQATSYACLVRPIAPLTLVTNGEHYRLFDSVTREEVAQDTPIRDGLGVSLPSAARAEALEIFLGLSPGNLLTFCRAQAAEQLRSLTGSASDLSKVFVPELHVERREFHAQVESFLRENESPVFVLLGESGAGKTSSMCHLVGEMLRRGQPVLFFRGLTIRGRLLDSVAEEFEWTFGDAQRASEFIRRIGAISPRDPLLIAVDAIEEWEFVERVADLVAAVRHLRGHTCKLLLSCKTANWDAFLHRSGTATGIADYVFAGGTSYSKSQSGYVLPPMSDTEFHWAVMNYRTVFGFHGVFEQNAINEARRNPYLLRVFFDAARDYKLQNLALTSRELLDHYYDRLLARTGNRERAEATLLGVAGVISQANQPYIRTDVLRDKLNLGVNDTFMPELFEQNLLSVEHGDDARGNKIGFYSEPLRNYLIAYRVLDLPSMPDADLGRLAVSSVGMEADAFAYYFPQSTSTQQRAVVGPAYIMFEQYLQLYRAIIDAHFARLRTSFEPHSEGPIGIVVEWMLPTQRIGYFGFRAIRPGDADVLFIPVKSFTPSAEFLFAHGVNQARMNSSIERRIPNGICEAVRRHEIGPQLLRMVARGELDESGAPELSRELLREIIAANPKIFSDFVDSYTHQLKYPIAFTAIESAVRRACLYEHFDHIRCEDQRRAGRVSETRNGQFVSYSWQSSVEDRAWVEQHVSETLHNRSDPEHLLASVNSQYLFLRVRTAIQNLGDNGSSLEASGFCVAGGLPLWNAYDRLRMDPTALGQAFANFYKAYLDAYQEVVSASFPTLKNALPLYSNLPVRVLVAVSHPHHWEPQSYPVLIAICPPQKGQNTNDVIAIDPVKISYDANHQPLFNGEPLEYFRFTSSYLGSELSAYPPFLPDLLRISHLILRHKVYHTIESEIDSLLTALSKLTETSAKKG